MGKIIQITEEIYKELIDEGRYDFGPTPYNSHVDVSRNLGTNPLYADVGCHSSQDTLGQVSTFDRNGQNFKTDNNIVVSDNKFTIYKIKNFGNDNIKSTLSLFGEGAYGEKELRRAIDQLNGAASRNGRSVSYRTITSDSSSRASKRTGGMSNTFWEFSLDGGSTWYILKPNPVESMRQSKLVIRTDESKKHRITEAQDEQFSLDELSSLTSFNQRVNYCKQHLGFPIGNGSSRIVFQLDDEKCLKLAKNDKGVAQNDCEVDWYKQKMNCFPKIYDADYDNSKWIVCEYVLPAKQQDFKHCLGITWLEFTYLIATMFSKFKKRVRHIIMPDEQFNTLINNNEYLREIYDYIGSYDTPIGDLLAIHNYGLVRRNNKDIIVILDHGLSDEIWDEYYSGRR